MSCTNCNCTPCSCPDPVAPEIHTYLPEEAPLEETGTNCVTRFHEITLADFTVPTVGADVNIEVCDSGDYTPGMWVYIVGAGYFSVQSITDDTHILIRNLGPAANQPPGTVISEGAGVVPGFDVSGAFLADDVIQNNHLDDDTVGPDELQDDAVGEEHIQDGAIQPEHLAFSPVIFHLVHDYGNIEWAAEVPGTDDTQVHEDIEITVPVAAGDLVIFKGTVNLNDAESALTMKKVGGTCDVLPAYHNTIFNLSGTFAALSQAIVPGDETPQSLWGAVLVTSTGDGNLVLAPVTAGSGSSGVDIGIWYLTAIRIRPQPVYIA